MKTNLSLFFQMTRRKGKKEAEEERKKESFWKLSKKRGREGERRMLFGQHLFPPSAIWLLYLIETHTDRYKHTFGSNYFLLFAKLLNILVLLFPSFFLPLLWNCPTTHYIVEEGIHWTLTEKRSFDLWQIWIFFPSSFRGEKERESITTKRKKSSK